MVSGLVSCDISYELLVNGSRKYSLSAGCGSVVFSGRTFSDKIFAEFDGDFIVYPDSFKFRWCKFSTTADTLIFSVQDMDNLDAESQTIQDTGKPLAISGRKRLTVYIRKLPPLNLASRGTVELFPSNFILCDGQPVITDTIVFERNQKLLKQLKKQEKLSKTNAKL